MKERTPPKAMAAIIAETYARLVDEGNARLYNWLCDETERACHGRSQPEQEELKAELRRLLRERDERNEHERQARNREAAARAREIPF